MGFNRVSDKGGGGDKGAGASDRRANKGSAVHRPGLNKTTAPNLSKMPATVPHPVGPFHVQMI